MTMTGLALFSKQLSLWHQSLVFFKFLYSINYILDAYLIFNVCDFLNFEIY